MFSCFHHFSLSRAHAAAFRHSRSAGCCAILNPSSKNEARRMDGWAVLLALPLLPPLETAFTAASACPVPWIATLTNAADSCTAVVERATSAKFVASLCASVCEVCVCMCVCLCLRALDMNTAQIYLCQDTKLTTVDAARGVALASPSPPLSR